MNDKETIPSKTNLGGIGRNNFIKESEGETTQVNRDINDMDMKEGQMNNGEKGGNFDEDAQEEDMPGQASWTNQNIIFMNKELQQFEEQHAPLKNTDKAFVKVNKDGSPNLDGKNTEPREGNKREAIEAPPEGQGRH